MTALGIVRKDENNGFCIRSLILDFRNRTTNTSSYGQQIKD